MKKEDLKHGMRITCTLGMDSTVVDDARISIDSMGGVYACQNKRQGVPITDKLGYKYSWLLDCPDLSIHNIKIVKEEFSKKDLRIGMRVETANEGTYMVMVNKGVKIYVNHFGFMYDSSYLENFEMKNREDKEFDIVKVFSTPSYHKDLLTLHKHGKLLWERDKEFKVGDYVKLRSDCDEYNGYILHDIIYRVKQNGYELILKCNVKINYYDYDTDFYVTNKSEIFEFATKEEYEAQKVIPEYTMEEAVELIGHDFKIKK